MSVKIHHCTIPKGVQFLYCGVIHPRQGCVSTPLRHPIYTYNGVTKITPVGILGGIIAWVCVKLHTHGCNLKVSQHNAYNGVTKLTPIGILGGIIAWVCVKLHTHGCNLKVSQRCLHL